MKRILVIGSLNMDLVSYVPHLPRAGETISSTNFSKNPGGKGANQAVAAARLKADVAMIGKVGMDDYGKELLASLTQAGVNTRGIEQKGETGMAFINVSAEGENSIVLVPGANAAMQRSDIDHMQDIIHNSDILMMQLEIPLDVVEYASELAAKQGKIVILNPAPAQKLPDSILRHIHTIIPNETELQILTGMAVETREDILKAALSLKALGIQRVIVTMGANGSYLITDERQLHIPANKVKAIDTTAAGDSYIAGFATGLTMGMNEVEAAKFATKVSAIVITREGAQPSLPTLKEVLDSD